MKSIILLVSLLFISNSYSQITEEWAVRYNGPRSGSDIIDAIVTDDSGNVYVTGTVVGAISQGLDIVTIKYNSAGEQKWIDIYNGTANDNDYGRDIVSDDSGNVYVTGLANRYDFVTIKYDPNGLRKWVNVIPNGYGFRIKIDNQGFIYVVGNWLEDMLVIKYNSSGSELWRNRFKGSGNGPGYGKGIDVDNNGNVYITGNAYISPYVAITTVKYSSSGVLLWSEDYHTSNPSGYDDASDIAVDGSGNVYVCGSTGSPVLGSTFITLMYSPDSILIWADKYTEGQGKANRIFEKNGNVYVTGYSMVAFNFDYTTIKYNSTGRVWASKYNGFGGADIAYNLFVDDAENVFITGGSPGQTSPHEDLVTVKYDSSGVQQGIARYNGPGNNIDLANDIELDKQGNIYVAGRSWDINNSDDYITIKYSGTTGVEQNEISVPDNFVIYQNYPNPFNPTTLIRFQLPVSGNVTLKVYDVLGNQVATLVNEDKSVGTHEVEFDGSNLSSGIYFYQLQAGSFIETKKMILIK